MLNRRLSRGYEALPARSTAMTYIAMIALMTHRLTKMIHPTWRGLQYHINGASRGEKWEENAIERRGAYTRGTGELSVYGDVCRVTGHGR